MNPPACDIKFAWWSVFSQVHAHMSAKRSSYRGENSVKLNTISQVFLDFPQSAIGHTKTSGIRRDKKTSEEMRENRSFSRLKVPRLP